MYVPGLRNTNLRTWCVTNLHDLYLAQEEQYLANALCIVKQQKSAVCRVRAPVIKIIIGAPTWSGWA